MFTSGVVAMMHHYLFPLLGHQLLRLGHRIRERLVAHPGQKSRRHPFVVSIPAHGHALKVPIEHERDRNPTRQTPPDDPLVLRRASTDLRIYHQETRPKQTHLLELVSHCAPSPKSPLQLPDVGTNPSCFNAQRACTRMVRKICSGQRVHHNLGEN